MTTTIEIFIALPRELINQPSTTEGYESFYSMTDVGKKIFNELAVIGLQPIFTVCDVNGRESRDENGQLLFTGIIIRKEIPDA